MPETKNKINFYHQKNIEIVRGESLHDFPRHSHDAFCIGIVTDGRLKLECTNREYILEKNNVYFIPPHTEHRITSVNENQYGYVVVCVKDSFIEQYNNATLYDYVCDDEKTGLQILNICRFYERSNNYTQFEESIKQFLKSNVKVNLKALKKNDNEIVMEAVNYIIEHLDEPFNLDIISDYVHISKYHFLRLFKTQMGTAPYQFYLQGKVKKIKQGLLNKQNPANMAYDLNFTDQSHLCNTFKKYVGLTPAQFKKSYKEY